ncbi:hypothetical protein [Jiella avicenniae]|uniref:Uncharacterized protein n=1 Tax=Jiella avicenniae TaxID=2907202 RepID=A0A9X1P4K9_9HYPH|nr:hypothetical protein [Jiella avicenniae]MCE7030338.1 hypothetical protein [Jiella avicenniae]
MTVGERLEGADVYDGGLPDRLSPSSGSLVLRASLLFAGAFIALALIVVPIADRGTATRFAAGGPDLDMTITGSISSAPRRYTVHRSVLQAPGSGPCILFADGSRQGSC